MGKDNKNFTSAFKELLVKKNDVVFEDDTHAPIENQSATYSTVHNSTVNNATVNIYTESARSNFKPKENYISPSSVFVGTIETKESISIDGVIKGSVTSGDVVTLKGSIEGNVYTNSIDIAGGAVKGDVAASDSIIVDDKGIIIGNISSDSCSIDGKIKGNIVSVETVSLKSKAYVFGDVSAKKINIQEGSIVYGNVKVLNDYKITEDVSFEKLLNSKINSSNESTAAEIDDEDDDVIL